MTREDLTDDICGVLARSHGGSYSRALRVVERLERLGLVVLPRRDGTRDAIAEAIDAGVRDKLRSPQGDKASGAYSE